jgi:hypothetical protein
MIVIYIKHILLKHYLSFHFDVLQANERHNIIINIELEEHDNRCIGEEREVVAAYEDPSHMKGVRIRG